MAAFSASQAARALRASISKRWARQWPSAVQQCGVVIVAVVVFEVWLVVVGSSMAVMIVDCWLVGVVL